jgi:hypothetical protein
MTAINRKRAFSSPESQFRHPQYVVRDPELSHDDKIAVLRNWKVGLVQKQMAGEDGYTGTESTAVAAQLAAISQAIRELRQNQ